MNTHKETDIHTGKISIHTHTRDEGKENGLDGPIRDPYGVATISRLLEIKGLFCKRAL